MEKEMNTIELVMDAALFGGHIPNERLEEVRRWFKTLSEPVEESHVIEVDFNGDFKTQIKTTDKNLQILRAVNGYGHKVDCEGITTTDTNRKN